MLNKIGYCLGKLLGISIYILVFCGILALLKIAMHLLKWFFYGTFII